MTRQGTTRGRSRARAIAAAGIVLRVGDAAVHPRSIPPRVEAGRLDAALEVACLLGCVAGIMWLAPLAPRPGAVYAGLALVVVVLLTVCHLRDGARPRDLGFRLDNFFAVLGRLAVPIALFAALMLAAGALAGTLRFGPKFFGMLVSVPLWGLMQHYMLLAFTNRRLRALVGPGRGSVAATAALFALLHLPNPALTVACAAGGYVWAREYERDPNLFAHAVTHALASALLANSLPSSVLKNMVVGYNYFLR